MYKKLWKGLVLASVIILSSCTTEYIKPQPLPVPSCGDLPTIQPGELECLSDAAYEALVKRDALQASCVDKMRAVIESTH